MASVYAVTCENECQNGGVCIVTNMCDCTGTGYTGPTCETGQLVCGWGGGGGGIPFLEHVYMQNSILSSAVCLVDVSVTKQPIKGMCLSVNHIQLSSIPVNFL